MAYTFLDNSLNTIGVLTNKGGQTNDYWGDSITHEIATSQDVLTSVSLSVDKPSVNIDTSGNQKTWNHVIQGLSFNIDGIGRKVNENDYLIYQEGTNGKYYLMAITQVDESAVQSGFHYKTVQGLNAAAYDLSRKTLRAKSFAQIPDNTQEKGTAQNILKYIFEDINWDVRTIGSFGAVDYDIAEGTTAQAVLLDIIGMFEAEVDAYVQLNNWGKGANVFNKNGSIKRIFDFSTSLGKYRGETIRYDKNMVSITKTGARDSMYTKLYVNGNNITIADANKGADFIVDDVANRKYNKLGAVSTPVTYLEGIISNSAIESPTALLAWGKKQLKILNHPRYNYQISATNDDKVQLGDTVIIQDTHASDPIYLKSKVISKTVSLADPVNNSFIVGEFSPIVIGADNGLEDTNQIMQLVNQANQTAINAQNKANENAKKIVDTRTNLEKTIDQKLQEGKDYSDSLDEKQKEAYDKFEAEINKGLEDAQKERDEISKKADDMLTTANSHADDMYNNAVAVAKDEASKALSDANTALYEAKTDLTDGLNKEIADRNKAVSAVNSQAQDYATQAKSDAIAAAETADGVVRKDFKVTTDALSSTISQNKQDSDGKISTAQSTATQALNGLSTKVSQTDYDKKTSDLSTKVNTVTQTATETKNALAKVSKTVGSQSAKINTISNTVDGTTQTISDIQTEQGKQSRSIATLQSRADGFDATVTKVNNLSVGGTNLVSGTNQEYQMGYGIPKTTWQDGYAYLKLPTNVIRGEILPQSPHTFSYTLVQETTYTQTIWFETDATVKDLSVAQITWYTSAGHDVQPAKIQKLGQNSYKVVSTYTWPGKTDNNVRLFDIKQLDWAFNLNTGTYLKFGKLKLEAGNMATDWSPAPEDVESRVTALKLDIDGITGLVNDPKKGLSATAALAANGLSVATTAKNAATTAIQTANGTQTTVTNVQKDVKDLQSTTTQMAGQVTTEIEDRKNGDKSVRTDMANLIDQRITDTKKGYESAISQSANTIMASVSMPNQLLNTEFNPDLEGWTLQTDPGSNAPYRSYFQNDINATVVGFDTTSASASTYARFQQTVQLSSTPGSDHAISMSWYSNARQTDNYNNLWVRFYDNSNTKLSESYANWADTNGKTPSGQNSWNVQNKWENISIPDTATYLVISFEAREGTNAYLGHPMLVFGSTIGDTYMPGSYSGMNTSTVLELFKDNWALGIADNAGRIISGINGDTSGTVIQGKKLVINSDTTINGKAFIDGSVIKNASIGTAQIGKAAVGSAQIINVDVSKISGNIANFITGNINTLNSNVLYGDTGYLGTVNTGRVVNNQDHHLQLASHGQYNPKTHRAQFELLSYDDPAIDDDMKGSLNYYSTVSTSETRGIRFKANHILAIDTYRNGAGNLYLSAYARGEVRITNRDGDQYAPIAASNFRVASQRSLKSDITDLKDGALNVVNSVKIHEYTKSGVSEIGVITDEVPDLLKTNDGKAISLYDYTSVLYKAVQELSQQVKELQDGRSSSQ